MNLGTTTHFSNRERAFTLIELLAVVAIIGLLAALALPSVVGARKEAGRTQCLSNIRQLALAFQLYADDHDDRVPPNRDGEGLPLGETWVEGWLGAPGPDCTNILYLKSGLLGRYLPEPKVWKCPSSRPVKSGPWSQDRVRTVSINAFVGANVNSPSATTYRRRSDFSQPGPSQLFTVIEERAETINDGAFSMQWDFDETRPESWMLRDQPAVLHSNAGNLSFGDGHVESRRWLDFLPANSDRNDQPAPRNRDVLWLQTHGTSRERSR